MGDKGVFPMIAKYFILLKMLSKFDECGKNVPHYKEQRDDIKYLQMVKNMRALTESAPAQVVLYLHSGPFGTRKSI